MGLDLLKNLPFDHQTGQFVTHNNPPPPPLFLLPKLSPIFSLLNFFPITLGVPILSWFPNKTLILFLHSHSSSAGTLLIIQLSLLHSAYSVFVRVCIDFGCWICCEKGLKFLRGNLGQGFMSFNQSRSDKNETQYRKTGRSAASNQQHRGYSPVYPKGAGAAGPAPSISSQRRSFFSLSIFSRVCFC